jgi:SnoaL-like domain
MSAHDEIRNLVAAYCHALDDGRVGDVVACFCAEGTVDIPGLGTHTGHDALRAAYEGWKPRRPQRHLVVNTHITGDRAVSDLVFMVLGDDGWKVQMVGRYDDELCDHDGVWRFHRRTASFVS